MYMQIRIGERHLWCAFVAFFFFSFSLEFLSVYIEKLPLFVLGLAGLLKIKTKVVLWELIWVTLIVYILVQSVLLGNNSGFLYGMIFLFAYLMALALARVDERELCKQVLVRVIAYWQVVFVVFGLIEFFCGLYGLEVFYKDYFIDPYRADSFYSNPNPFSVVSVLLICLLDASSVRFRENKLLYSMLVIGAILGGASISIVAMFAYLVTKYFKPRPLVVIGGLLMVVFFPLLLDDAPWLVSLYNKRVAIWEAGLAMLSDSFLLGVGFGMFQKTNELLGDLGVGSQYGLHSMYYSFLVESGLVGFVLLILFVYFLIRELWLLRSPYYPVLVAVFVSQFTEFYLDHEEVFILIVAVLFSFAIKMRKRVLCNA